MAYQNNGSGGNRYGKGGNGPKKNFGDKKPYGEKKSYGDKPYGERKSYGDKPYGEKKQYGDKPYGEKKSFGDKPYGEKKPYGDKPYSEKKSFGDKPYGEKKPYGDKPYGEKKSYGDKPYGEKKPYGERKSYGDKPYGEKKPYGDKPYGERKSYGDKPYGEKKSYGDKPYGEKKSFGDKPYGEKKPYGDKPYGERKPYGQKPYGDRKPYEKKPYDKTRAFDRETANTEPAETAAPETDADELPYLIIGRNAVREAVKSGRSIDRILVSADPDGSLKEILGFARDAKLVIREVDRRKLDEVTLPFGHGGKPANHQGIVAYAAGVTYCSVDEILDVAKERGEEPFIVVLDGVQDPQNLGSIIRSADCAGAHGVILGKRRSASVTPAAVKASAGAVEHVKIARVTNINGVLEELKRKKLWIAGADMDGTPMDKQGLNGALALVIGGEGDGLTKLVRENCDFLVSIPMTGHIGSLNAGVAAAILMFEKRRQDASRD